MPRPQFTLKTMLWVMACIACFGGGLHLGLRVNSRSKYILSLEAETRQLREELLVDRARKFAAIGTATEILGAGESAFLFVKDQVKVFVAADEEAEKTFVRFSTKKDQAAILSMTQSGRLFWVPNNTPATIIEVKPPDYRVRLNGGAYDGREVFIHQLFVFRDPQ